MTANYAVTGTDDEGAEIFPNLDAAVRFMDWQTVERDRLRVFLMKELPESALWDWSTRPAGDDGEPLFMYTNEQAARNCMHGDAVLLKRRRGTSVWVPA